MTQATGDLLTVENLNVEFDTYGGIVPVSYTHLTLPTTPYV